MVTATLVSKMVAGCGVGREDAEAVLKRKVIFVLVCFGHLSPIATHMSVEKLLGLCPASLRHLPRLAYPPPAEREQRDTRINNP